MYISFFYPVSDVWLSRGARLMHKAICIHNPRGSLLPNSVQASPLFTVHPKAEIAKVWRRNEIR